MNYLVHLNYLVLPRIRVRVNLNYSISTFCRVGPANSVGHYNLSQYLYNTEIQEGGAQHYECVEKYYIEIQLLHVNFI